MYSQHFFGHGKCPILLCVSPSGNNESLARSWYWPCEAPPSSRAVEPHDYEGVSPDIDSWFVKQARGCFFPLCEV